MLTPSVITRLSSPIPPLDHRSLHADQLPIEQLARNPSLSESEKVQELCRQFEAILVRQILRDSEKSRLHNTLNENSSVNSVYREMVYEQLGNAVSHGGHLGFATSLEAQFNRFERTAPQPGTPSASNSIPRAQSVSPAASPPAGSA